MRALGPVLACISFMVAVPARAQELAPGDPADLLQIESFMSGLDQPTSIAFLPDGSAIVTQKQGEVILRSASGAESPAGMFAVDSNSEKGLLNVLPHPDFEENRLLFFYYSAEEGSNLDKHRVVTVELGSDGQLDMTSEQILVRDLRGPSNHDGGALAFSADGRYLYVGVGDTGCNSGQPPSAMVVTNYFGTCLTNGNGKILRVALDGSIPADNPLVGEASVTACGSSCGSEPSTTAAPREDIFAWGFRNPWRIWTDPQTGYLWVGDVGEVTYEEIDVVSPEGGAHYGWPYREGNEGAPRSQCSDVAPDVGECTEPVYFCRHGGAAGGVDGGCESITGGLIIDDCRWPSELRGRYVFGDYGTNRSYSVAVAGDRSSVVPGSREDLITGGSPVHYAMGPDGGLYVVSVSDGEIHRVTPQDLASCDPDAGGSGGGSGTGGGAGSAGSAGTAAGGGAGSGSRADAEDDDGCGCRTPGSASRSAQGAWLLALALGLARRRSKR